MHKRTLFTLVLAGALAGCSAAAPPALGTQAEPLATPASRHHHHEAVRHVLLLSIDGLHEVDLSRFIAAHPTSALSALAQHGVQYTNAWVNRLDGSATNPSDSFPGLLALATGGSSRTHGGWYDVSYARDLFADATCAGAPGTAVTYDETIDVATPHLWGSASDDTPTHLSSVARGRLDPTLLPHRLHHGTCSAVYPHQFIRTNTIFEVAKLFGLHTAWSDKHLAYELVNGPSGEGVDDFFAPEINSDPSLSLIPSAPAGSQFTDKVAYTKVYDDYKVQAILNEIAGKWSDAGLPGARDVAGEPGTPAIFGMNFQALSVAQKSSAADGGYADAAGTPNAQVADALAHTDASIGKMVAGLAARHLLHSTLIIVTAKHGQSPIDKKLYHPVSGDAVAALIDAAAPLAGHIEDDVALYWLKDATTAPAAVHALLNPPAGLDPRVDTVFTSADAQFKAMFGDIARDAHTPDLVVKLQKGTIYSLSKKKDAEHGGFADDDAHVGLLVANPALAAEVNDDEVRTKQVAPTILRALDIDPRWLDAVRREHTHSLPDLDLD
jgi:hypothetical protein